MPSEKDNPKTGRFTAIEDIHFSLTDVAKFLGLIISLFVVYTAINQRLTRVEMDQDNQSKHLAQVTAEQRLLEKRFNTELPALMTTFRTELRAELRTMGEDVNWIRNKIVEWKETK